MKCGGKRGWGGQGNNYREGGMGFIKTYICIYMKFSLKEKSGCGGTHL